MDPVNCKDVVKRLLSSCKHKEASRLTGELTLRF